MKYAKHHHPARSKADRLGKDFGGVCDLARRIGHGHHQLAVNIADGKQQRAANGEAQNAAQRAAAQQPIVHDDQPAHADHGAPAEGEVIDHAELAGKSES